MVELKIHPHRILVEGGDEDLDHDIHEHFTFSVKEGVSGWEPLKLAPRTSKGVWVPRGLQRRLVSFLKDQGVPFCREALYEAVPLDLGKLETLKIPPYPHQHKALTKLLAHNMGIMSAPTASGKGNMIAAASACIQGRIGVFTKNTSLVQDLEKRILDVTGEAPGVMAAYRQKEARVTILGADWITTQHSRSTGKEDILETFDAILVDECHGWATNLKYAVLQRCTKAALRYGFSGTALDRGDGRTPVMVANLGPVTSVIHHSELKAIGALPEETIVMVLFDHKNPQDRNSYTDFYAANIYNNRERNALVADLLDIVDHPCIVFAERQKHIEAIGKISQKKKFDTEVVYGPVKDLQRKRAVARAAKGELEVIVGSRVLFTGNDMPALRSGIMTDAGRSVIQGVQKIGRVMRKDAGKDSFNVFDIADLWPIRGADDKPIAFESQAKARWEAYVDRGYNVEFVRLVGGKLVQEKNPWK